MKVYNQEKTQILEEYDLKAGYLKEDTITTHYDEVKEVKEEYHYKVLKKYLLPGGKKGRDLEKVIDRPGVSYSPARDEVEDIYIYIPYTEKDLEKIKLNELRAKREPLLVAFDKYKTNVLYGIEEETEEVKQLILSWYYALLELSEAALNEVPERISYYL